MSAAAAEWLAQNAATAGVAALAAEESRSIRVGKYALYFFKQFFLPGSELVSERRVALRTYAVFITRLFRSLGKTLSTKKRSLWREADVNPPILQNQLVEVDHGGKYLQSYRVGSTEIRTAEVTR
jgi:hypothetical protein